MNFKKLIIIGLSACFILLLVVGFSSAEVKKPITIKLGHVGFAETLGDDHAMALVFKDTLEKMSGGAFEVKIFPAGQLGGARDLVESVNRGTLKACITTPGEMSMFVPEIEVMAVPFIFSDPMVFYKVTEGPWGEALKEKIRQKTNMRCIALGENGGFRNIVNSRRTVRTPADMKGLKIRTIPTEAYMEIVRALGASPTPMPWLELYTACQTGTVDGQQMMIEGVITGKMYEVQHYITLTQHIVDYTYFLVNEAWFDDLPSEYQTYIMRAGKLAERAAGMASCLMDATGVEKLQEEGMDVYIPTKKEREMFKEACQPHMIQWLKKKHGAEAVEEFLTAVERAERELTVK